MYAFLFIHPIKSGRQIYIILHQYSIGFVKVEPKVYRQKCIIYESFLFRQ